MLQVNVTLPTVQHNGTSNQAAITAIKREIAKRYGGYSSRLIDGGWVDSATGHLYEEQSVLVWTFVDSEKQASEIRVLARGWARDLKQIELLVTVQPVDVSFVEGTREQALA